MRAAARQASVRGSLSLSVALMRVTLLLGEMQACARIRFWPSQEKHTQRQRHNKLCLSGAELLRAQVSEFSLFTSHSPPPLAQAKHPFLTGTSEYKVNLTKKATELGTTRVTDLLCGYDQAS